MAESPNGNESGNNALEIWVNKLNSALENDEKKTVKQLMKSGSKSNIVDENGWTALMWSSAHGYDKIVQQLLKSGADNKAVTNTGMNALMYAAESGNDGILELLIKSGCDVNHVTDSGLSALMSASLRGYDKIVEALIKSGSDVNIVDNNGMNALMLASGSGHDTTVKLLIENGSKINAADKNGNDALMFASSFGNEQIVELLMQNGSDFNAVDKNGWNALMHALDCGSEQTVEILLKFGCDVLAVNKDGTNALGIALEAGHKYFAELLQSTYIPVDSAVSSTQSDKKEIQHIMSELGLVTLDDSLVPPNLPRPKTAPSQTRGGYRLQENKDQKEPIRGRLQDRHYDIIRKKFNDLIDEIDAKFLTDFLFSKNILSFDDRLSVTSLQTPRERTRALLDIILYAGPRRAFPEFINSLKKPYPHIAVMLGSFL